MRILLSIVFGLLIVKMALDMLVLIRQAERVCAPGDVQVSTLPPPLDKVIWSVRACVRISGDTYGWVTIKPDGWFPASEYKAKEYRLAKEHE